MNQRNKFTVLQKLQAHWQRWHIYAPCADCCVQSKTQYLSHSYTFFSFAECTSTFLCICCYRCLCCYSAAHPSARLQIQRNYCLWLNHLFYKKKTYNYTVNAQFSFLSVNFYSKLVYRLHLLKLFLWSISIFSQPKRFIHIICYTSNPNKNLFSTYELCVSIYNVNYFERPALKST